MGSLSCQRLLSIPRVQDFIINQQSNPRIFLGVETKLKILRNRFCMVPDYSVIKLWYWWGKIPRMNLQVAWKVQNSILGGENLGLKKKSCCILSLWISLPETEGFTLILFLNKGIIIVKVEVIVLIQQKWDWNISLAIFLYKENWNRICFYSS